MIGKKLSNKSFLKVDAKLDRDELKSIKEKLTYTKETILANENILSNLNEVIEKKRKNYNKVKSLKIKSSVEKDREFYDLVNSQNQYLSTKKEINSLKTQVADLELRIVQLNKRLIDKNLQEAGFILYSIDVKVGQVVTVSTPLAKVADISQAILTIYLSDDDVKRAKSSLIYINGEKTAYKISRLLNIADSKNISKYMAQILIESPSIFSKLVKIELKDK